MTEHNDLLYIDKRYINGFIQLLKRFNHESDVYTIYKLIIGDYEYSVELESSDFVGQTILEVSDINKPQKPLFGNIKFYERIYKIDINIYNVLDKIKDFERKLKLENILK